MEGNGSALRDVLEELLEPVPERERTVLRLRFGLVDGRQHTVTEVEQETGVPPDQIEEIEAKGLRLVQHPYAAERLKGLMETES